MAKFIDAVRGMSWVRLECSWPRNPKVLALVEQRAWRAMAVYVAGLAYSGEHGLDGFLPRACLPFVHGSSREARQLVEAGLWEPGEGGWSIHDWHDYQPTAEEAQKRREKARLAAETRWKQHRADQLRVVPDDAHP